MNDDIRVAMCGCKFWIYNGELYECCADHWYLLIEH